jgi:hypothetical protein
VPNVGLPFNFSTLVILLLASSSQDVDEHLETLVTMVKSTQEAIRNIRQGIQTVHQSLLPAGKRPPEGPPEDAEDTPKLLSD